VAAAAITGREMRADHETVVILLLLAFAWLMAVEAIHAVLGVGTHLVLVHDGVLQTRMTLRAFSAGSDEVCGGLFGFDTGTCAIDEECAENEREGDGDGDKDRAKRHGPPKNLHVS
jgi:hypothetical protein